jgi:hypothetical protein
MEDLEEESAVWDDAGSVKHKAGVILQFGGPIGH